jgi:hypothetical protein
MVWITVRKLASPE